MIVVVSEDADFCETVQAALRGKELPCQVFDTEESARDYLRDNSVLVEVLIYDSDLLGTDFLRRVRAHRDFQLLPILVAAEAGVVSRVEDFLDLGASYFLAKPVQEQRFMEYFGRILESQQRHKSNI
jgi:DNA-binding NtrC family response regulator